MATRSLRAETLNDPLVSSLAERVRGALRADHAALYLLDADNVLRCYAAADSPEGKAASPSLPPIPLPRGLDPEAVQLIPVLAGRLPFSAPHFVGAELCGKTRGVFYATNHRSFADTDRAMLSAFAEYAALAVENFYLREQQARSDARQKLLDHISEYLQQTLDLGVLISRLFAEVNKAIHAEAQSVWLVNENAGLIACCYATGPGAEKVRRVTVPLGEGIVGTTVAQQQSLLIADAQTDHRHSRRAQDKTGMVTHSLMSVPMIRNNKAVGAIQAINKQNGAPFDEDDLHLFRAIADIATLALENARLFAELEASYDTTLDALTAALDARDKATEGHSRRVVEYTARLATQIGLDEQTIRAIRRGALIHDIGKIGIPDAILHKPGMLTPDERQVIERHPEMGFDMLRGIPRLRTEIQIVLTHQERWDGAGYPLGLKGEEIPLEARLFMIADTFDALCSDRPYRARCTYEEAALIIARESGKQFDPALVAAFLAVPESEWKKLAQKANDVSLRRAADLPACLEDDVPLAPAAFAVLPGLLTQPA